MAIHLGILISNILGLLLFSGGMPMAACQRTITANGVVTVSGDKATLTLNATAEGTFQCSLDGGTFQSCHSGTMYTGVSPGSHVVDVRFMPKGVSQTLSLKLTFDVDSSTPPPTPTPTPVTKEVNSSVTVDGRDVTITLNTNIPSTFRCMLDNGRFRRCKSGDTFRSLDCGSHTLKIKCSPTGSDDEFDLRPLQFSVACPTIPGTLTLDGFVVVTGDSAAVTLSSTATGNFECSIDKVFERCYSGFVYHNLSPRRYCIRVRFTPTNSSQVIPFRNPICFRVRRTPSPTPIEVTATATITTSGDTATITLSSTGRGSFRCMVDDRRARKCKSGDTLSKLKPGKHTIEVQFTPRGSTNVITIPVMFNITVVETPFVITGQYQIAGNDVQVFFNTTKPATCTCKLGRMRPVPCMSGHVFQDVTAGMRSIQVMCRTNTRPRMKETLTLGPFMVMPQPPTRPPSPPPPHVIASGEVVNTCDIRLTFSANVTVTYLCRVNGGPWEACFSGKVFSGLQSGRNTIEIEASVVGFPGVKTTVRSNIDLTGQGCPLSISCPICNPTVVGSNFTFRFQANRPGARFFCSLNDEDPSPCSDEISYTIMRRRGQQKFTVTVEEGDDNITKMITFRSKYKSGQCQVLTCGDGVAVSGTAANLHFTSDDPEATFTCRLNRRPIGDCTSPLQLTDLPEGENKIVITPTCGGTAQGVKESITFTV